MRRGARLEKSLAGDTTLAAMLVVSCASMMTSAPKMIAGGVADARDEHDRIPDRLAKHDHRRAGDGDADERKRRHRRRQAERLSERLRSLAARIAREVGNVEAQRRPVADVRGERGRKELPERACCPICSRTDSSSMRPRPPPRSTAHASRMPPPASSNGADQPSSRLMPSRPLRMIQTCTSQKIANEIQMLPGTRAPARPRRGQQRVEREAANPGLNAEPAARDERAQHRRHVGALRRRSWRGTARETTRRTSFPAWALRIIGMSTMTLPSRMVSIACHQFMPCCMSPEASV